MRTSAHTLVELVRTYGARGLARRAAHEVLLRSGAYRGILPQRAPASGFAPVPLDLTHVRSLWARHPEVAAGAIAAADAMIAGHYPFFSRVVLDVGWPPPWHRHPRTGEAWDATAHWTAVDQSGAHGDVKWIWEPSRFAFAWVLPRALVASGDPRYAVELARALEDWWRSNPPFRGAAWACAQETSLRALALVFALSACAGVRPLELEDPTLVDQLLHASARRIAATLRYALSQRNNHAVSEAVALWVLAVTCPAWPESSRWQADAVRALREVLPDQFAPDGSYIQESLNYQRLALHLLLFARWISRSRNAELPDEVHGVLERSLDFLVGLLPAGGGALPNYGANDGALLLALSSCDYDDYRPTLQHLALETRGRTALSSGPWDEPAAWLGLPATGEPAPRATEPLRVTPSGYLTSRRRDWMVFSRIPCHRDHRPTQADALHVDVWRGDDNLALDPGTYAYSEPPPWDNRLVETRVHNTCSVGTLSQMRRRGRFLWTHWSCAALLEHVETDEANVWLARVAASWTGRHFHWRLVAHRDGTIDVLDRITGDESAPLRVHWNLLGTSWRREEMCWTRDDVQVSITAPAGAIVRDVRGDPDSELGWESRSYGERRPCTAIEAEHTSSSTWFHTRIGLPAPAIEAGILQAWCSGDASGTLRRLVHPRSRCTTG